jgi:Helix-turn-helix domain
MGLSNDIGATELAGIDQVRARVLPGGRLTAAEAAKYLGKTQKTLANWRVLGIGPAYSRAANRVYYKLADLDRFMDGG